ncbi:hypothetical protein AWV79_17305 [Cupriavidus sp. UYMMa02A]|nr:hypothetical protein AWV79_17305 [Cupriavidus sp. UYMMa02A]
MQETAAAWNSAERLRISTGIAMCVLLAARLGDSKSYRSGYIMTLDALLQGDDGADRFDEDNQQQTDE